MFIEPENTPTINTFIISKNYSRGLYEGSWNKYKEAFKAKLIIMTRSV